MKKLLIGFLALSLVAVFAMPVAATDFDISGTYYIRGWYDDNSQLESDSTANALYQQRLRVKSIFKVVEGLKLTVRLDALEQTWGSVAPETQDPADVDGVHHGYTNDIENGNVKVEMTRLDFVTKVGLISAGYWDTNTWGLTFGNNSWKVGRIQWTVPVGDSFYVVAGLEKDYEGDARNARESDDNAYSDRDNDAYILAGIYKGEQVEAGLLWKYVRNASFRPGGFGPYSFPATGVIDVLTPYFKANFDPFYVEGQLYWADGTVSLEDWACSWSDDVDLEGLTWYLMGKYSFGPAYIGGLAAYAQGDDPNSTEREGFAVNGGWDWNPCLILWNDDFNYKAGGALGHEHFAMTDGQMRNAFIYQIFGGWDPIEDLSLKASYSIATVDQDQIYDGENPVFSVDDNYGSEFDLTANYKIYDNIDYMVGFGYFWAGDFYKGNVNDPSEISNTYLLVHKLTLSF